MRCERCKFDLWVKKIRWRRAWQPTPAFLPGESHGQSLAGYSPCDHKDQTWLKWLSRHALGGHRHVFCPYHLPNPLHIYSPRLTLITTWWGPICMPRKLRSGRQHAQSKAASSSFSSVLLPNTPLESMEQESALEFSSADDTLLQYQQHEGIYNLLFFFTCRVMARGPSWGTSHTVHLSDGEEWSCRCCTYNRSTSPTELFL